MPLNSHSGRIAEQLAQEVARGADADRVADLIVATWMAVETSLAPIIGAASVAVLYTRSRHIAGRGHPWLTPRQARIAMDLPELRSLLTQQDAASAAAGGGGLLQTFYELLSSLVGPSLTERLLHAAWTKPSTGGPAAQDTSP